MSEPTDENEGSAPPESPTPLVGEVVAASGPAAGMTKSQITLILGIATPLCFCIPCVGSMLAMVCFLGTMGMGFVAHKEAKETGEDTMLAKVGMGIAFVPIVLIVFFIALYVLFFVFMIIAGNM